MTFAELTASTNWTEVKAALLWLFPQEENHLSGYRKVFWELRYMTPEPDPMRIAIECRPMPDAKKEEDRVTEVVGRNGALNRDLDDFKCLEAHATPEHGAQEVTWSLSLWPRKNWLGMAVEPESLRVYSAAHVIAHCLSEMTFHGFSETETQEVHDELQRRVSEIDAMSEEERADKLIPAEKLFAELKNKHGFGK